MCSVCILCQAHVLPSPLAEDENELSGMAMPHKPEVCSKGGKAYLSLPGVVIL